MENLNRWLLNMNISRIFILLIFILMDIGEWFFYFYFPSTHICLLFSFLIHTSIQHSPVQFHSIHLFSEYTMWA